MKASVAVLFSLLFGFNVIAMPIFRDGRAEAVIVVPDGEPYVAEGAARELADYLYRATGQTFPIQKESAVDAVAAPHQIHVGGTRAARARGAIPEEMAPFHYAILSPGDALYLVGHDEDRFASGTHLAVYHWLDEALGVRWLWPGASGTRVPPLNRIETARANPIHGAPSLQMALFQVVNACPPIEYSDWMRKHRANPLPVVPNIPAKVWEHFGAKHPEYFALHPNGKRAPEDMELVDRIKIADSLRAFRYQLCLSNPDLHRTVVQLAVESRRPGQPLWINAILPRYDAHSLFNGNAYPYCSCSGCREWDGLVESAEGDARYSRRYGRYLSALLAEGKKVDPSARVVGQAAGLHVAPPKEPLGPDVVVWITPEGLAPARREFWQSWRTTGAILAWESDDFRTRSPHPILSPEELGADFRFYREHGIEGFIAPFVTTDCWPGKAPHAYMIARMQAQPSMSPAEVMDEYTAALQEAQAGAAGKP